MIEHIRDVRFSTVDSTDLLMDLYLPSHVHGHPVPIVVWLHGGGWALGDRFLGPDLGTRAGVTGLAYATIEYRLSGVAPFPAQLHDVRAAIRFLRENALRWNLDPSAIGLWGGSAGGHLAALTGVTGHIPRLPGEPNEGDASVAAVSASYPPVDLAALIRSKANIASESELQASFEARLLGDLPSRLPDLAASTHPGNFVTPHAPAFQLSHGTSDALVPHEQSEALHRALLRAGVRSDLYLLEGYRHGFLNPPGVVDVSMQTVMDDGRLNREGAAQAVLDDGSGTSTTVEFDFGAVDRFFIDVLTPNG